MRPLRPYGYWTSPDPVLWMDEAGSRKVLMGVIKKGGPRKMAEHLISDLKKAVR